MKYRVLSQTVKDKKYIVEHFDTGKWTCECPAYMYRREDGALCKHINRAKEYLKEKGITI
jgi:hypothetical protein